MILCIYKRTKILIHAGSGGVGTFAIQLAKIMGATVTTTASEAGTNLVTSLGADQIINYKTEKFEEILKNYDAVFDTIGGTTLEKSFNIIKAEETLFQFQVCRMLASVKNLVQASLKLSYFH